MAAITLEKLTKRFGPDTCVVDEVTLQIEDGEFLVLVGPSGCGKTTLLRMIAGLEAPSSGDVFIGDRRVTKMPPGKRDVAMVFQDYALFPQMSVRRNMGFGLTLRKTPKADVARRVDEVADVLELSPLLERKPSELSGGQRQRVAMGRAMVREPEVFLMDEPLSNLDAKLRVQMRAELASLRQRLKRTTVYVTHDQVEAMTLGDRVVVLRDGLIQQVDTPQRMFRRPANVFVAAFMGSPAMNLAEAVVLDGGVSLAGVEIPLAQGSAVRALEGRNVIVGIRPTDLRTASSNGSRSDCAVLRIMPEVIEDLGSEIHVRFAARADAVDGADLGGDDLTERARRQFTACLDPNTRVTTGTPLDLLIAPGDVHYFDPESGERI
ncbi:ABC transporter ATP-binding protein [Conexibacter woesei]|uniref:ABC transporter related protein n=1 Tax=Conexibacter woesei (strain DSM 14684 / CCUG 47730 / CIP 108061 / JCM 11494 / NBRC 100937 / ID131577) TaxID=469383 RepID=D3F7X5_CONWI|nr:sn-glycerol-3-phosphate ABC transporter ATP-binding protein UgpC [Conexibacter woesei]ADB52869.1 ABC transporter related protein [Conexibacter woesei DSM 14684]